MIAYELRIRPARPEYRIQPAHLPPDDATFYFGDHDGALRQFNRHCRQQHDAKRAALIALNKIMFRTNLRREDWLALLASDAPGDTISLTPQDLIESRIRLRTWHYRQGLFKGVDGCALR